MHAYFSLRRTYKKLVRETIDGAQIIEEKKVWQNKLKYFSIQIINSLLIGRNYRSEAIFKCT